MSAQYRPYRNEDGLDADHVNWDDQELGDVQIYQKTTEDIRYVSNRNLIIGGIGVALLGILLGILIGYFAHSEHTQCVPTLAVALHSVQSEDSSIRGKILKMVNSEEIKKHIMFFSSRPHLAGSQVDKELAENVQQVWVKNGLDKVSIESYDVLLSCPDSDHPNQVFIIDSQGNKINVSQPTKNAKDMIYPYSAYSPAGIVKGDLVFVNYGLKEDFLTLQNDFKVDLHEKIFIAKQFHLLPYEQIWNAHSFGAKGLILYPDPKEYNPPLLNMTPYPNSWWLPGDAVRSDSALNGAGDPLTPGHPSKDGMQRISLDDAVLPQLHVQPISYNDAYHLLNSLGGEQAPESWQGGLNFTYHIGPGFKEKDSKVQIEVNNVNVNKTIYNVIGYIRGKTETDRYVLIGSGRDAWSYGAVDSAGGTAALLELSRVFGQLLKQGWRPRRTIIFCSWGAEQFSLTGSTEWLEENYESLHSRAVAYIDASVLVTGNTSISVEASPLLYHAIFNATKEVPNPNEEERSKGIETVYDSWLLTFPAQVNMTGLIYPAEAKINDSFEDFEEHVKSASFHNDLGLYENYLASAKEKSRPRILELNMKSRYAPFHYGGIPVVDVTYVHDTMASSLAYPVHHTEYDDFHFVETFIDPTFKYHTAVVQVLGEILRDLADSLFVPFNILDYAVALQEAYSTFHQQSQDILKKEGVNLDYFNSALKNFTDAAVKFHAAQELVDLSDPMTIRRINDQLLLLERAFQYYRGSPSFIGVRDRLTSPHRNALTGDIDNHYFRLIAMLQSATQTISDLV